MEGSDFMITVFRFYRQCKRVAISPVLISPVWVSPVLIGPVLTGNGDAPKLPAICIVLQIRMNAKTL
jgi:hypothetical protein